MTLSSGSNHAPPQAHSAHSGRGGDDMPLSSACGVVLMEAPVGPANGHPVVCVPSASRITAAHSAFSTLCTALPLLRDFPTHEIDSTFPHRQRSCWCDSHAFYTQSSALRCQSICIHHPIMLTVYCRSQAVHGETHPWTSHTPLPHTAHIPAIPLHPLTPSRAGVCASPH